MNHRIQFLLILSIMAFRVAAHPGFGIVANSKGEVFYTDLKQVWKITPAGKLILAVTHVHTHELYLDAEDNLYGEHLWYHGEQTDTWGHYVWKLSPDGSLQKIIPDQVGFLTNYSFVRDHSGRMYWADRSRPCQTIMRHDDDNSNTRLETPCFHNIRKLETLRDGSIAVLDFQDIKRISPAGRVTTVASKIANKQWTTSTVSNQNSVMGIWEDHQGNLYAAVLSERVVKRFRPDGAEEVAFKTKFPWSPSGGMVDAQGRLWILECNVLNDVRVERLDSDGKLTLFKP